MGKWLHDQTTKLTVKQFFKNSQNKLGIDLEINGSMKNVKLS